MKIQMDFMLILDAIIHLDFQILIYSIKKDGEV